MGFGRAGLGGVEPPIFLRACGGWTCTADCITTASVASLLCLEPSRILSLEWWGITAAVGLLFGYVWQALAGPERPVAGLSPTWAALARPRRRSLEADMLYHAFLAQSLLLLSRSTARCLRFC